jgi:di/tricarboxylate transporter
VDFTLTQGYVLIVITFLVFSLYKELLNPAMTFFVCTVALLLGKVIQPADVLKGLSNDKIIIIFLLVLVTAGIRLIFGVELFGKLFKTTLTPKAFLLRMMVFVSTISAFLNNTPIVAFMIPYVKEWSLKTGNPASKFLIPLSYATVLGGMMTVIGTSTNLVLNGLITEYKLTPLGFQDFFFLGVTVTLVGWVYFYFIGYNLLPSNENKLEALRENVKEYIIETEVFSGSRLVGKSVKDAGLRNLQDLFLVEIIRDDNVISPVSPNEILGAGDLLFFSGNTAAIYNLIKDDNGLRIPKQDTIETDGHFNFVEGVIPANSELVGVRLKDSDFRKRYKSSVIAVHRNGKQVPGKVGEAVLAGGDFLLLLAGSDDDFSQHEKDLYFLSTPKKIETKQPKWLPALGIACFAALLLGVTDVLPLFHVSVGIIMAFVTVGVLNLVEIRKELDLSLLLVLVCSLAVGVALEKSGTAALLANVLINSGKSLGTIGVMTALFLCTIVLTSLITNAAAVAIVFPIAMSIAAQMNLSATPFFVAIAFAASGDFLTPIGYQTNLMVYGPGGYTFKDFTKVGAILTLLYCTICITFISYYYKLV